MDIKQMRCRLLEVEGSFNVRDLGGYPTADGGTVQHGRFFRAGSLSDLTPKGIAALRQEGVDCILDLRSTRELENRPDAAGEKDGFAWHHVPMLDYIQSNLAGEVQAFPETMDEMYRGMVDMGQAGFARAFALFAQPGHRCCLFHCTAGKDRTGVTAMLLLSLAGVAEADILEDYSWSEHLVPPFPGATSAGVLPQFLTSRPETIRGAMEYLQTRYGGPEAYLLAAGVTASQLEAVRHKLLSPTL